MSSVNGDSKNFQRKFLSVGEEKKSKCPKGRKKSSPGVKKITSVEAERKC